MSNKAYEGEGIYSRMLRREELSEEEFQAIYEWLEIEKDTLHYPVKKAILKLFSNEAKRRIK